MRKQLTWVVVGLAVLAFVAPNAQAAKKKAPPQPVVTIEQLNQLKEQIGALTSQNYAQKQEISDLRARLDQVSTLTAQSDAQKLAIADLKGKLDDYMAKAAKAEKAAAANPLTSVGGVIYLRNMTDLSDNTAANSAEKKGYDEVGIDRVYLNFTQSITPKVKMRVTTDIYQKAGTIVTARDSGGTKVPSYYNGWDVRLKYAYVDLGNLLPQTTFRLGMLQSPWIDYVENLWKYRVVSKVLMDVEGQFSSADLGGGILYKLPKGYGEFYGAAVNGTGYENPENNKLKDYVGRLALNLIPKWGGNRSLQVAGYYYNGYTNPSPNYTPALYRTRAGGFAYFAYDYFSIGAEYDKTHDDKLTGSSISYTNSGGFSVFGEVKPPQGTKFIEDLALFGRYDKWDPNTNVGDTILGTAPNRSVSAHTRMIGGISYQVAKNVRFMVDGQRMTYNSGGFNGVANVNEDRLYENFEVKF
jgi:hypothetical protein